MNNTNITQSPNTNTHIHTHTLVLIHTDRHTYTPLNTHACSHTHSHMPVLTHTLTQSHTLTPTCSHIPSHTVRLTGTHKHTSPLSSTAAPSSCPPLAVYRTVVSTHPQLLPSDGKCQERPESQVQGGILPAKPGRQGAEPWSLIARAGPSALGLSLPVKHT